jgi:hypothetical protein
LLNEVGEAVIDCIRYARPKSDVPFLFLEHFSYRCTPYPENLNHA